MTRVITTKIGKWNISNALKALTRYPYPEVTHPLGQLLGFWVTTEWVLLCAWLPAQRAVVRVSHGIAEGSASFFPFTV